MSQPKTNIDLKYRTHTFSLTHILHIYKLRHLNQCFNCFMAGELSFIHLTLSADLKFDISHSLFHGMPSSSPDHLQFCRKHDAFHLQQLGLLYPSHHDYTNKLHCCAARVQSISSCSSNPRT